MGQGGTASDIFVNIRTTKQNAAFKGEQRNVLIGPGNETVTWPCKNAIQQPKQNFLGFQKELGFVVTVHHHQNRDELLVSVFDNKHNIRTSKPCTSQIQHSFSLTRANRAKPSINIFGYQTLNLCCSLNNQWFFMI